MRPRPTLKIIEIFSSVQGEGLRQGEPTIFVRLAGCNLRCSFCDTKSAWTGGGDVSWLDILERVRAERKARPSRWVCLTGGEPLLQDISRLVRELKSEGFFVQIETNGTVDRLLPVDWYTVSPKPPDYGYRIRFRKTAREVKLVVNRELSYDTVRKIRGEFPAGTPLLLQPESNKRANMIRAMKLLDGACRDGLDNVRVSLQLHKVFSVK